MRCRKRITAIFLSVVMVLMTFFSTDILSGLSQVNAADYVDISTSSGNTINVSFENSESTRINSWTYTGEAITPTVIVKVNGTVISSDCYTLEYGNNINASDNEAYVIITGIESKGYTGTYTKYFTISTASISSATISLASDEVTYIKSSAGDSDSFVNADVTVIYNGTTLVENTDYALSYSYDSDDSSKFYVCAEGKGNYSDTTDTVSYTVVPASISDQTVKLSASAFTYDGTAKTPTVTITDSTTGIALDSGVDYTCSYSDNTEIGTATVTITGIGNYTGTTTVNFYIVEDELISISSSTTCKISLSQSTVTYNGSAQTPDVTVTYNGVTLVEGTDYTLEYSDNTHACSTGSAIVTVTGMGLYTDSQTAGFTINRKALSADYITASYDIPTYNYGATLSFDNLTFYDNEIGVALVSGTDIKITYTSTDRVNAGDTVITISAAFSSASKCNYSGSCDIPVTINPLDITGLATITLDDDTVAWTGSEVALDGDTVTVSVNDIILAEGTDYNLVYSNNVEPGTATVTAEFIGNYTGEVSTNFTIKSGFIDISDADVTLDADTYTYTGQQITPKATVTYDETTLIENTDYTVSYGENINAGTGTVTITGTKNTYAGSVDVEFEITEINISSCDITGLDTKDFTYTGEEITYDSIVVSYGGVVLTEGTDFEVWYEDNEECGTATVYICGINNFIGTKTYNFTISQIPLTDASIEVSEIEDQEYNFGEAVTPDVTVYYGNGELEPDVDYTLSYQNNTSVGVASVVITGKGNYNSEITATFNITAIDLVDAEVELSFSSATYTGNAITNSIKSITTGSGITISDISSFAISSYDDNVNAGECTVEITSSSSNYTGTASATFTVNERDLENATVYVADADYNYGDAITFDVTVYDDLNNLLIENVDYEILDISNEDTAGSTTIEIQAIDGSNYTGTASGTGKINTLDVSEVATLSFDTGGEYEWTGSIVAPYIDMVTAGTYILEEGYDYEISYSNNISCGTATITISGINNFTGSIEDSFTIIEKDIADCEATYSQTEMYTGSEIEPTITLTSYDYTLVEGTDYTVTYEDNIDATDDGAKIIVTGIGNLTGTVTYTFSIISTTIDIDDDSVQVTIDDMEYNNGYAITPDVYIYYDGVSLVKDSNYTVEFYNNTSVGVATAVITGIGAYSGTIYEEFNITAADLTYGSVTLSSYSEYYTGDEITPEVLTVTASNGNVVEDISGFDITYSDNIEAGTGYVTVTGDGYYYTGTITASFAIVKEDTGSDEEGGDSGDSGDTGSGEDAGGSGDTGDSGDSGDTGSGDTGDSGDSGDAGSGDTGDSSSSSSGTGSGDNVSSGSDTGTSSGNTSSGSDTGTSSSNGSSGSGTGTSSSNGNNTSSSTTTTVTTGQSYTVGTNKYQVTKVSTGSNGTVTVTKVSTKKASVTIPATVTIDGKTYKVTAIAKNAFKGDTKLTTLVIGSNVKTIGANAFSGCTKLKKVTIGKNVTTIGASAFKNCKKLTKVTIPSKVTSIGKSAFINCTSLKTVTIGKSVKKIGAKAFYNCKKLSKITIKSKKLTTSKVGSKAFGKIKSTAKIKVPKSKKSAYKKMLLKKGVSKKATISA